MNAESGKGFIELTRSNINHSEKGPDTCQFVLDGVYL
jgi:hypothetical protein